MRRRHVHAMAAAQIRHAVRRPTGKAHSYDVICPPWALVGCDPANLQPSRSGVWTLALDLPEPPHGPGGVGDALPSSNQQRADGDAASETPPVASAASDLSAALAELFTQPAVVAGCDPRSVQAVRCLWNRAWTHFEGPPAPALVLARRSRNQTCECSAVERVAVLIRIVGKGRCEVGAAVCDAAGTRVLGFVTSSAGRHAGPLYPGGVALVCGCMLPDACNGPHVRVLNPGGPSMRSAVCVRL